MQVKDMEAEIRHFLDSEGISIAGFSEANPIPSVPEDFSPGAILKNAKSVICYGVPVPRGIIHAESNDLALYWRYCNMLYRSLDLASIRLCLALEKKGCVASPIYGCYPWRIVDHEYWGLLPLVYWAQEAGLGRLSKCGLLTRPGCGTGILLGGVVTTMALEPTGKLTEEVCPPGCLDCIHACPANAIEMTGKVDHGLCIRNSGANPLLSHLLKDREVKENFSFETLLNTVAVDDHGSYTCFECLKICPLNAV